jgi:hypothetical protein
VSSMAMSVIPQFGADRVSAFREHGAGPEH